MANEISTKRIAISKTNAQIVTIVAIACFVSVFCLVATKTIFSQNSYQQRLISKKQQTINQLNQDLQAASELQSSYQAFISTPTNVIGGDTNGSGGNDGDNAKIVLDALPSTYDFPALTSSIEKILNGMGLKIDSITGTDDAANQANNINLANPQPISMPFTFTVEGANYSSVQQLIATLLSSIRPMQIDNLDLSGKNSDITLTVQAHTYYQPSKSIKITSVSVK